MNSEGWLESGLMRARDQLCGDAQKLSGNPVPAPPQKLEPGQRRESPGQVALRRSHRAVSFFFLDCKTRQGRLAALGSSYIAAYGSEREPQLQELRKFRALAREIRLDALQKRPNPVR